MNTSTLYTGIAIVLAIAVITLFFFFPNYIGFKPSTSVNTNKDRQGAAPPAANTPTEPAALSNALQVQDVQPGSGAEAKNGDLIAVEYVGRLADGTVFDQSSARGSSIMPDCNKPNQFCFRLGEGRVIQGWDQGLIGMKVGGERTLTIPPNLAYGSQGVGPIPPNATLTFNVKLVGVNEKPSSDAQVVPVGPAS